MGLATHTQFVNYKTLCQGSTQDCVLNGSKDEYGKMEKIKYRLRYEGIFYVEGRNRGGGITLLWKERESVRLLGFSRNHVDSEIQAPNLPKCRFMGFYGYLERHRRRES